MGQIFYVSFVLATALFVFALLHRQENIDKKRIVSVQIAACHRGNALRDQINRQASVEKGFMYQAILSVTRRSKLDTGAKRDADLVTIRRYNKQLGKLKFIPRVKCEKVIDAAVNINPQSGVSEQTTSAQTRSWSRLS